MPLLGRLFADDEDFGKKDDDRKPGKVSLLPTWSGRKSTSSVPPYRKRTVLYAFIACIVLYFFFKNIPEPTHPPIVRPNYRNAPAEKNTQKPKVITESPTQKPPRPEKPSEAEKHYYDGPIRFYHLAASLYSISRLRGHVEVNKNVLFAACNLRSASELIPIACEMANWQRNDVHFALMGRDDLEMDEVKTLNGVDEQCKVNWHDARPDFSPWSSDFRMEVSVAAALGHIQTFMHPQVLITDDASREDGFFTKSIRSKAFELGRSVIELPLNAAENLMWIARLDSASLAAWHTTYIDILIHAPPHSSGSLLRLMKSIEAADYFGHRRPHLTIELPADIDRPTWSYLEELTWPPVDWSGAPHESQVTLRHRIPRRSATAEEASIRQVESFYPARPADSHVLVLSPQVELSPLYFHFLMYQLLEYKYSTPISHSSQPTNLMGISLDLPYMHLNASMGFSPPLTRRKSEDDGKPSEDSSSFLWQAPNSNVALYFGDKWIEYHSFLISRTALDPAKQPSRRKLISELYPAWLEHLQELMRLRGYTLLYPNLPSSSVGDAIATLHYELYQPPEEFSEHRKSKSLDAEVPAPTLDPETETFPVDPSAHHLPKHSESTPLTSNLNSLLPKSYIDLSDLPLLSHEGNEIDTATLKSSASIFAREFRRQVGLCPASYKPKVEPMKTDDLFCNSDENLRSGLGLGDLEPWDLPYPGVSKEPPLVIEDGDEVRQSEFEAHLSRQGREKGGGEDSEGASKEKGKLEQKKDKKIDKYKDLEDEGGEEDEENKKPAKGTKEKPMKAKGTEKPEKGGETEDPPEEKPRGW
ncbi:MAG: hypothetical protein Q9170_007191 [Blastenia crenularia]